MVVFTVVGEEARVGFGLSEADVLQLLLQANVPLPRGLAESVQGAA